MPLEKMSSSPTQEHDSLERIVTALADSQAARRLTSTTAIGLGGFVLCTTPLSMVLMGWRGATGLGAANLGSWLWPGGIITILGAIGDWISGHTFPAIVFSLFGGFWCAFATTLIPDAGAFSAYSDDPSNPYLGLKSPSFYSSLAFFLVAMAMLCIVFLIAALRTNIAFCLAFAGLVPTLLTLAASFWCVAEAQAAQASTLQKASGGILFAVSILGWYILSHLILATTDFPYLPPLGDLSRLIKGAADKSESTDAKV